MSKIHFIKSLPSTNDFLKEYIRNQTCEDGFTICTDFQTKGKGQQGNTWESEKGKNLLFSFIMHPNGIPIDQQFIISQLISISILEVLKKHIQGVSIKWPNDIYWKNKKIGGILIENSLQGNSIKHSIIGVGLNINQLEFPPNLPNPVSLKQIIGKTIRRRKLLHEIISEFFYKLSKIEQIEIRKTYTENLFRTNGFHLFKTESDQEFTARIVRVELDGKLILETPNKEKLPFYFKEVQFII